MKPAKTISKATPAAAVTSSRKPTARKAPPIATKAAAAKPIPPKPPAPPADNVRLEYYAPLAHEVFLAGTFNQWRPSVTAMHSTGGGLWVRELTLAPGKYEYLFLVDGQWLPDPAAKAYTPNPYGGMNSLLEVLK